jgi:hypothetical protein
MGKAITRIARCWTAMRADSDEKWRFFRSNGKPLPAAILAEIDAKLYRAAETR